MRPLTSKQLKVLKTIHEHQMDTGLSPTLQELGAALEVNRVTVYGHVQALLQKGHLENLEPGASRGLDLTDIGMEALQKTQRPARASQELGAVTSLPAPSWGGPSLPLLGTIAAGAAIEAIEERQEVQLGDFLRTGEQTYMLEVLGDSMIQAHIQSGDYVLVRRDQTPQQGDIVVAILEDETATLKRFFPQPDGTYILQPANDSMQPIICETLEVRGVVTGVVRRY
ncbi:MAG: transcriptional repressor LexA [Planctomycetota bacterium]|nr:transcriptional repressor LexA [Planctomycetota bacterium]